MTGARPATPAVLEVQVFGTRKNAETRKALRFFSERRIRVHFVDVDERPPALGELRRFFERFGVERMIDRTGRRFAELGLAHARYSDDWWLRRSLDEPHLLQFPLVRAAGKLSVGHDEATWRSWLPQA